MDYLIKGLIIGFAIAIPIGPIGILCIKRSLIQGKLYGIVSGLGAASADAIYGVIAGSGHTVILHFLVDQRYWIQIIGGCFLCFLGFRIFYSRPTEFSNNAPEVGLIAAYTSILFLTLSNPITILSFLGVFLGMGFSNLSFSYSLIISGVFFGSFLWWVLLCLGVNYLKNKMEFINIIWINRISGSIIFIFGVVGFFR